MEKATGKLWGKESGVLPNKIYPKHFRARDLLVASRLYLFFFKAVPVWYFYTTMVVTHFL